MPIEYIYVVLNIMYGAYGFINHQFFGKYFKEKVFDNIIKILLDFSLNKKKNVSKLIIDRIISYIDKFLGFSCFSFRIVEIFGSYLIEKHKNLGLIYYIKNKKHYQQLILEYFSFYLNYNLIRFFLYFQNIFHKNILQNTFY